MFKNKRGDIEIDTLVMIIIAVVFFGIAVFAVFLLKGKGGNILGSIKSFFRFGFTQILG